MKRYKIAHRYVGSLGVEEDEEGEWIRYEDIKNFVLEWLKFEKEIRAVWNSSAPTPIGFFKIDKFWQELKGENNLK